MKQFLEKKSSMAALPFTGIDRPTLNTLTDTASAIKTELEVTKRQLKEALRGQVSSDHENKVTHLQGKLDTALQSLQELKDTSLQKDAEIAELNVEVQNKEKELADVTKRNDHLSVQLQQKIQENKTLEETLVSPDQLESIESKWKAAYKTLKQEKNLIAELREKSRQSFLQTCREKDSLEKELEQKDSLIEKELQQFKQNSYAMNSRNTEKLEQMTRQCKQLEDKQDNTIQELEDELRDAYDKIWALEHTPKHLRKEHNRSHGQHGSRPHHRR